MTRWLPMEIAPKDEQSVLLYQPDLSGLGPRDGGDEEICVGYYYVQEGSEGKGVWVSGAEIIDPKGWIRLPETPDIDDLTGWQTTDTLPKDGQEVSIIFPEGYTIVTGHYSDPSKKIKDSGYWGGPWIVHDTDDFDDQTPLAWKAISTKDKEQDI